MKKSLLTIVLLTAILSCSAKVGDCHRLEGADSFQKEKIASIAPKQDRRDNVAVLSKSRGSYRLCNTRPQRLLPTSFTNFGKTQGKHGIHSFHRRSNPFKLHYDGRRRQETAPFCSAASCDYYVIALRRIIR